ncbi:PII interaction protein X [Rippkaea orientalis PCC 8801]|uniref:PII interaction protein X n=1 Tax=Rippkaea orientalis (strain PCC 8801 / RF-1) TaxID=41431 RepID=B7JW54_RIPO1|nr:PipX family protein [Rippkaea orientalis]ACK65743.1 PII interaction protein X [Rippkaea orientalis PCC 8801]
MSNETYFNHPTFGLLYRVCILDDNQELFTTLYAQRLFFLIKTMPNNTVFEPVSRSDARLMLEARLRNLRRLGATEDYQSLYTVYKTTFP